MLHAPLAGYDVTEKLAQTSWYAVNRAVRKADGRPVWIKLVIDEHATPGQLQRLRAEHARARELAIDAVLAPLALVELPGGVAVVYDAPATARLLDRCIQRRDPGSPADIDERLRLAARIAAALAELHARGIVHKDVQPHNIVVGVDRVRLTGLGLAIELPQERPQVAAPRTLEGLLPYMSPESTGRMNQLVDARSDLYSLGVTCYELFAGRLPFTADDPLAWIHCHLARTPAPLAEVCPALPAIVGDIVDRLLAKIAADRYQSALGVAADLERCVAARAAGPDIARFPLGGDDGLDSFQVSQRLHGREAEIAAILAAHERMATTGGLEIVLIAGYSGVGKSSLVHELHRPLVARRGLFLSGKFDQYARDVPYATIVEAFRGLVQHLLAEPEAQLAAWRRTLREALGDSAGLVVETIPQLALVLGPCPAVGELPLSERANRFNRAFWQFVQACATADHPLVVFLDDLQWADPASLHLIQHLLVHPETRYLHFLGAYRDNEVSATHPLSVTVQAIEQVRPVQRLALAPLTAQPLAELLASTLRRPAGELAGLADLLARKTDGNPFFVHQYLIDLHRRGLIEFDRAARRWTWDVPRIEDLGVTTNVADVMSRRLRQLPGATQDALGIAACLGHRFELDVLAGVVGCDPAAAARDLWPGCVDGLVVPPRDAQGGYEWLHDRIQQTAYSSIPPGELPGLHLRIGRVLRDRRGAGGDALFELVGHLDAAEHLIDDPAERLGLAALNLEAGRRAKRANAFDAARPWLEAGARCLPADAWTAHYELAFALHCELAECLQLVDDDAAAQRVFELAQDQARGVLDAVGVLELRVVFHMRRMQVGDAVARGLDALALLGHDLRDSACWASDGQRAVAALAERLARLDIAGLIEQPVVTDPMLNAAARILQRLIPPAFNFDLRLFVRIAAENMTICLDHGHTETAAEVYASYAMILLAAQHHAMAFEVGRLAQAVTDRLDQPERRAPVLFLWGHFVSSWREPLAATFDALVRGHRSGIECGDFLHASMCLAVIAKFRWSAGPSLTEVDADLVRLEQLLRESHEALAHDYALVIRQALHALAGETAHPCSLSTTTFSEDEFVARAVAGSVSVAALYHLTKLALGVLLDDLELAEAHCPKYEAVEIGASLTYQAADHALFRGLLVAARHDSAAPEARPALRAELAGLRDRLAGWAAGCPANFADRLHLIDAELARLDGRDGDALAAYERAIATAGACGSLRDQAIAQERAGRLLLARGRGELGHGYLAEAAASYARWGARAKVADLERRYLARRARLHGLGPAEARALDAGTLDAMAVIRGAQAISRDIHLPTLIGNLLQVVIEHAGAQAGALVLVHDGQAWLEASLGMPADFPGRTQIRAGDAVCHHLPVSVLAYVQRSHDTVIVDDAAATHPTFSSDPGLMRRRPRSVLCLPMFRQRELLGMLYLENGVATGAFNPDRVAVLSLLSAQAAISIENATLYDELEQRVQARTAELQDANQKLGDSLALLLRTQRQLVDASRRAGMADVATSVLHEVGNALNGVSTSLGVARAQLATPRIQALERVAQLVDEHRDDLAAFLAADPRGQRLPEYLRVAANRLAADQAAALGELDQLEAHIGRVSATVARQSAHAAHGGMVEVVSLARVIEEAARDDEAGDAARGIAVVCELATLPEIRIDRHKLTQILRHLLDHARASVADAPGPRRITISSCRLGDDRLAITVRDTGAGIAAEDLPRMLSPEFLDRGRFGDLHGSACRALEMGGELTCASDGPGQGAAFQLVLPYAAAAAAA